MEVTSEAVVMAPTNDCVIFNGNNDTVSKVDPQMCGTLPRLATNVTATMLLLLIGWHTCGKGVQFAKAFTHDNIDFNPVITVLDELTLSLKASSASIEGGIGKYIRNEANKTHANMKSGKNIVLYDVMDILKNCTYRQACRYRSDGQYLWLKQRDFWGDPSPAAVPLSTEAFRPNLPWCMINRSLLLVHLKIWGGKTRENAPN